MDNRVKLLCRFWLPKKGGWGGGIGICLHVRTINRAWVVSDLDLEKVQSFESSSNDVFIGSSFRKFWVPKQPLPDLRLRLLAMRNFFMICWKIVSEEIKENKQILVLGVSLRGSRKQNLKVSNYRIFLAMKMAIKKTPEKLGLHASLSCCSLQAPYSIFYLWIACMLCFVPPIGLLY